MNSNTLNPYTVVEDVNDVVPRAEIDYVNGGQRQWAEIFENRPASSFVAFVYVHLLFDSLPISRFFDFFNDVLPRRLLPYE